MERETVILCSIRVNSTNKNDNNKHIKIISYLSFSLLSTLPLPNAPFPFLSLFSFFFTLFLSSLHTANLIFSTYPTNSHHARTRIRTDHAASVLRSSRLLLPTPWWPRRRRTTLAYRLEAPRLRRLLHRRRTGQLQSRGSEPSLHLPLRYLRRRLRRSRRPRSF